MYRAYGLSSFYIPKKLQADPTNPKHYFFLIHGVRTPASQSNAACRSLWMNDIHERNGKGNKHTWGGNGGTFLGICFACAG